MSKCKLCGTVFKFCNSCRYTPTTFTKSLGYCCSRCMNQDLDRIGFEAEYKTLMDYIEDNLCYLMYYSVENNKEELWHEWCQNEYNRKYREK